MHFEQLGLSEHLLKSLKEEGYRYPTPIQAKVIPAILDNQDVMAAAQTGTGKTAAFTLPILEKFALKEKVKPLCIRALILAPTRELAAQVLESVKTYGKHLSLSAAAVFGGVKINPQISHLKKGVDVLVATPGRLLDLVEQRALQFDQLEILVLDEADRMLDMGFIHDIKKIIAKLPRKRQTLLFSATFSSAIRQLAKGLMNNPVEISVTPANSTVKTVKQVAYTVDKKKKNALLSHLIWENKWEQVLVFTRTKWGANKLADYLIADGMEAVAIHGNKSQGARTRALAAFKKGEARVLVATDIAARGLDIELLPHVVNFDLPQVTEDYVHRIGRTGRAGASGEAITLLSADEYRELADIERLINQKIPRLSIDGFEPEHHVPDIRFEKKPERKPARFIKKEETHRSKKPFQKNHRDTERTKRFDRNSQFDRQERPSKTGFDRFEKEHRFEKQDKPRRSSSFEKPSKSFDRFEKKSRPSKTGFDRPKRFERDENEQRFEKKDSARKSTRVDNASKDFNRFEKRSPYSKKTGFDQSKRFNRDGNEQRFEKNDRPKKRNDFDKSTKKFDRNEKNKHFEKKDGYQKRDRFERSNTAKRSNRNKKR